MSIGIGNPESVISHLSCAVDYLENAKSNLVCSDFSVADQDLIDLAAISALQSALSKHCVTISSIKDDFMSCYNHLQGIDKKNMNSMNANKADIASIIVGVAAGGVIIAYKEISKWVEKFFPNRSSKIINGNDTDIYCLNEETNEIEQSVTTNIPVSTSPTPGLQIGNHWRFTKMTNTGKSINGGLFDGMEIFRAPKPYKRGVNHNGVDIWGTTEDNIVAGLGGEVINKYNSGTYGKVVYVNTEIDGKIFQLRYAHLNSFSNDLKTGGTVTPEMILGKMGKTGDADKVVHLHLEVRVMSDPTQPPDSSNDSNNIDPVEFFNRLGITL
jgi:murein DD-endopeptidase MepM/ murein hydrolase activator NlpD